MDTVTVLDMATADSAIAATADSATVMDMDTVATTTDCEWDQPNQSLGDISAFGRQVSL